MPPLEPLELDRNLLERVKARPLEVLELDLSLLTRSYLARLDQFLSQGLDRASEFLHLTSYLLYLKSRSLLPVESEAKEEEGTPPLEKKEEPLSGWGRVLEGREKLGWDVFCSPGEDPPPAELQGTLEQLLLALARVLERESPPPLELTRLKPLFQKMRRQVLEELARKRKTSFTELSAHLTEKLEIAALFLALLDLSFRQVCILIQNLPWGEIEVLLRGEDR